MGSSDNQIKPRSEEKEYMFAMQLVVSSVLPMAMQAVIELKVFEIIAKAGEGALLSPVEIASHLTTKNPEAPAMLDRMLRLLANHSILTRSIVTRDDGRVEKLYGLTPVCKYFIDNEDRISLAPYMFLCQDLVNMKAWYHTKDAVLEGGSPFEKVHGMNQYEYNNKDQRHNELFNKAMLAHTSNNLKKIVQVYKGFENLKQVVDVGGGIGTMSSLIYSKYPHIQCINYDLPHVIQDAPSFPGVKQVAGEMFVSVPKAETVLMKSVLHNWDDEDCVKVLKNSYEALPEQGMVIVVDIVFLAGNKSEGMAEEDVLMMVMLSGGKERTLKEFQDLAMKAGFQSIKLVCSIGNYSVMEFYKLKSN